MDQIMDNLVTPRIIAQALRVHPAAVLIAALIALRVLGLVGVVVAAPILATVALIWNYTMRKMLDLDPWPQGAPAPPPPVRPAGIWISLRKFWRERIRRTT